MSNADTPPHATFAAILELAEFKPLAAIRLWVDGIERDLVLDDEYTDTKEGQKEKLKQHFSNWVSLHTEEISKIELQQLQRDVTRLFDEADELIQTVGKDGSGFTSALSAFFQGVTDRAVDIVESMDDEDKDPPILHDEDGYVENDTRDLRRLEVVSKEFSPAELHDWARRGYDRLRSERMTATRAFAPLRFYSANDISNQLAAAYSLAAELNLEWSQKLLEGCLAYLEQATFHQVDELEYQHSLWRMLSLTQPPSTIVPIAKTYVQRLEMFGDLGAAPIKRALEGSIDAVVNSAPPTNASTAFFEYAYRVTQGMNARHFAAFLRSWIAEQTQLLEDGVLLEDIQTTWQRFLRRYQNELKLTLQVVPQIEPSIRELSRLLGLQTSDSNTWDLEQLAEIVFEVQVERVEDSFARQRDLLRRDLDEFVDAPEIKELVS